MKWRLLVEYWAFLPFRPSYIAQPVFHCGKTFVCWKSHHLPWSLRRKAKGKDDSYLARAGGLEGSQQKMEPGETLLPRQEQWSREDQGREAMALPPPHSHPALPCTGRSQVAAHMVPSMGSASWSTKQGRKGRTQVALRAEVQMETSTFASIWSHLGIFYFSRYSSPTPISCTLKGKEASLYLLKMLKLIH
jgi:hypothetical protein